MELKSSLFHYCIHLSLSWATSSQYMSSWHTSWRSIVILFSHIRFFLPSGLFPPDFPSENLYTSLLFFIRATCRVHLIFLDITRIMYGEEYRSLSSSLRSFLHFLVIFSKANMEKLRKIYVKGKGLPQLADVAQGVSGRLRPRIFLTFATTRVVGRQPCAPAAFTPRGIPGTHF